MSGQLQETGGALGVVTADGSDFASLLNKEFRPKSDAARDAVAGAVQTLAQQALANTTLVGSEALKTIEGLARVHVVLRRLDDDFCDPLELRADSALGVAGLVDCARESSVCACHTRLALSKA
jgi:hypothetical protein